MQGKNAQLVDAWIAYQSNWWAFEVLEESCTSDPDTAWEFVQQIFNKIDSDTLLSSLATGPLEDLLSEHAEFYIDQIEQLASLEPKFRKCLRCLWQNSISNEIWQRLVLASTE